MFAPISMDGFTSRIDGDIGWTLRYLKGPDYGFNRFLGSIGGVIFNRNHYTMLQSYDFKWLYGDLPCYVVTLQPFPHPPSQKLHFLLTEEGMKLHESELQNELQNKNEDLWLAGDNELISQFLEMGLVDEMTLLILPVTLGNGSPLIPCRHDESLWELAEKTEYGNGVVKLVYTRKKEVHS